MVSDAERQSRWLCVSLFWREPLQFGLTGLCRREVGFSACLGRLPCNELHKEGFFAPLEFGQLLLANPKAFVLKGVYGGGL